MEPRTSPSIARAAASPRRRRLVDLADPAVWVWLAVIVMLAVPAVTLA